MVTLSLDTNVVIEVLRRRKPYVRRRLDEAREAGAQIKVSTIVAHELMAGAHQSERPSHHLELLGAFLEFVDLEPWTFDDAAAAARLSADLQRQGTRIGAHDTLIAGQALVRGWTMVSADVREFARVAGLPLLDWSNPQRIVDVRAEEAKFRRGPMKD